MGDIKDSKHGAYRNKWQSMDVVFAEGPRLGGVFYLVILNAWNARFL
jgi:hypothetical protein